MRLLATALTRKYRHNKTPQQHDEGVEDVQMKHATIKSRGINLPSNADIFEVSDDSVISHYLIIELQKYTDLNTGARRPLNRDSAT